MAMDKYKSRGLTRGTMWSGTHSAEPGLRCETQKELHCFAAVAGRLLAQTNNSESEAAFSECYPPPGLSR